MNAEEAAASATTTGTADSQSGLQGVQQQQQPQVGNVATSNASQPGSMPLSQGPPLEASAPNSQSQPISNPSQLFSQATTSTADTDASLMMPPPTPGATGSSAAAGGSGGAAAARSSGRAIKPTMKVRGDSEEPFYQRNHSASGSISGSGAQNYGFRSRKSTTQSAGSQGNSSSSRALRLKLNLKGGHASRGKGDPTLAGVNKTLPYMQGYDRELDSSDDETGEGMAFEEQIILRMPENLEATKTLGEWVRKREVGNDGKEVEFKFRDSRRAVFKMGDKQFSSKLVDLPAIIESHKTLDNKQLFKIADISQMLLVTHEVKDESEVTRSDGLDKVEGLTDDFIYDHGITPPMRWARKRRFRKRIHKRTIETVEKEVERLLAEDERAEDHDYAMIDVAEADMSDSDDDGGRGGGGGARGARKNGIDRDSPTASLAPSVLADGASEMGEDDGEETYSQVGEGDISGMGGEEDDDVDLDLERELEEEMMLQQQEDEEEEDEEESTMGDGKRTRGRSLSRATSDDDDEEEDEDEDEEDEDDLFDAGVDEEGVDGTAVEGGEREDEEDDDDDMDEEEQERRVRETQLEAECKEIEAMVKRKNTELEGTNNALIKQRNMQTLKRMQVELDMKKSQLIDLKQQRKEVKEAAKAEAQAAQAQAQAQAELAAANAAAADLTRTSSSATPSGSAAAAAAASSSAQPNATRTGESSAPLSDPASKVATSTESEKGSNSGATTARESASKASASQSQKSTVVAAADDSMDVDGVDPDSTQAEGDEEEEEDDEDDDDEDDDLFR